MFLLHRLLEVSLPGRHIVDHVSRAFPDRLTVCIHTVLNGSNILGIDGVLCVLDSPSSVEFTAFSSCEIFPVFLCRSQLFFVGGHPLLVFARVDKFVLAKVGLLIDVSLLLPLPNFLIPLFGCQLDFLACEHSLLHDLFVFVDPSLLTLRAQVEEVDRVLNELLFNSFVKT